MSSFLVPDKVISILECIMRDSFWEGHEGSKLYHLVNGTWFLGLKMMGVSVLVA